MNRLLSERGHIRKAAADFSKFREIIDQPMGTITASGMLVSSPPDVKSVAKLLHDSNTRISTRAAWVLGSAAAKRVDISGALDALENALSDFERDMRLASGYAMTIHHLNRMPGIRPPLASHEDEAVRHGAYIALSDLGREF